MIPRAAGPIGSECVDAFVRRGDRMVAIDAVARSERPAGLLDLTVDLSDMEQLGRAFDEVDAALGAVDVLVQCATVVRRTPFLQLAADDVDAVLAVNVTALLLAT